jgi:hypothetical protein
MNVARPVRRAVHLGVALTAGSLCLVTLEERASALEPEITSDTAAQFYDVRSPTGETILPRRRLTTTLGASVYDLMGENADPNAPSLTFRTRMRYDADYGASPQETDVTNYGRLVPGYNRNQVDLMYGYVEGRKFFHGMLGFKVGRQYVTDVLGWWSFDGGEVRITAPQFVSAELYGGLEQRGGFFLSTSRWEMDGVARGDRSGYDPTQWPSFQPQGVAPAFGAAVETQGFTYIHSRLTYRRVENTGSASTSEFGSGLYAPASYTGGRISSERVGFSLDGTWPQMGGVKTGAAYDLYNVRLSNAFFSIDGYLGKKTTLSLDYDFYQPTFDADSIWNFFQAAPLNDLGVRIACDTTEKLSIAGGAHARMFRQQTESDVPNSSPSNSQGGPTTTPVPNYYPTAAATFDGGGNLAAKYKWGHMGYLGLRGHGNFGQEGDSVGGDGYGERVFATKYILEGRAGVWQWNDKLRPDRDAVSFGYTAGAGYRLAEKSKVLVEFDHNVNRIVGQRFRAMVWLTLAVAK